MSWFGKCLVPFGVLPLPLPLPLSSPSLLPALVLHYLYVPIRI